MFKMPEDFYAVPFDQLVSSFELTRPLPLPCYAMSPEAKLPTKENPDDFGWDLYPDHVVTVGVDLVAVETGLAVAIPPGYGAFLKERSGLARKYGVKLMGVRLVYEDGTHEDISGGVIDAGYRGPLVALLAIRSGHPPRTFSPADKVCQLVILPAPKFVPFWVNELPPGTRGDSGFGESGGVGSPVKPEPSLGPLSASVSVPKPEACPYEDNAWKSLLEAPSLLSEDTRCRCIPEEPDLDHINLGGINGRPPVVSAESLYGPNVDPEQELSTVHRQEMELGEVKWEEGELERLQSVNPSLPTDHLSDIQEATHQRERKDTMDRFKEWCKEAKERSNPPGSFTF